MGAREKKEGEHEIAGFEVRWRAREMKRDGNVVCLLMNERVV